MWKSEIDTDYIKCLMPSALARGNKLLASYIYINVNKLMDSIVIRSTYIVRNGMNYLNYVYIW